MQSMLRQRCPPLALLIYSILLEGKTSMLLVLAFILLILWIGGFVMFKGAGIALYLLLIFAIISAVAHFLRGKKA